MRDYNHVCFPFSAVSFGGGILFWIDSEKY